ncbi:MAG: ATP-dependent Clp protease ATP-binding subunit, partial [Clostridiales bacterium]|nr:ATP-dependent Clp protease ATP-binding subunit [Clostridiales bacterium]
IMEELKKTFRPEFLNRIDEIIVFHKLGDEDLKKIVRLMIDNVSKRLAKQDIYLEVTDEALDFMAKEGFDPEYGARPLRRVIQRKIEDSLSEEILAGRIQIGDKVKVDFKDGKLTFSKAAAV